LSQKSPQNTCSVENVQRYKGKTKKNERLQYFVRLIVTAAVVDRDWSLRNVCTAVERRFSHKSRALVCCMWCTLYIDQPCFCLPFRISRSARAVAFVSSGVVRICLRRGNREGVTYPLNVQLKQKTDLVHYFLKGAQFPLTNFVHPFVFGD